MKSEKLSGWLYLALFLVVFILTWAGTAHCQVSVGMAPPIHFQFFNSSGQPLANGKLYTYQAGTTTCAYTYIDASGTTQNPCPILLDSTGSPSNGSTQTGIFLSNASWKFVAYDVNNVFQWSVDNVTTYFALLNSVNTWTAAQTFSSTITDTLTDNQVIFGSPSNQTTFDVPPPSGNITLHFPSTTDTLVGRNTTDTLTNKTLTTPIINSTPVPNNPTTYLQVNNGTPGTVLFTLTKYNASAQATQATTSDTGGIIGITISNPGTAGAALIQEGGYTNCVFSNTAVLSDYVTISSSVAGDCFDAGSTYPISGQVIGRVVTAGTGTQSILVFPPEIQPIPILASNGTSFITGTGKFVTGITTLVGGAKSIVFTSLATTTHTGVCVANDITATNAVATNFGGNTLTLNGTGTDQVSFICVMGQ